MRSLVVAILLAVALTGPAAAAPVETNAPDAWTLAVVTADGAQLGAKCGDADPVIVPAINPGAATGSGDISGCQGYIIVKSVVTHVQYAVTGLGNTLSCDWPAGAGSTCTGSWTNTADATLTVNALNEGAAVGLVPSPL